MKRKLYIFLLFLGIIVIEGCTDLNEEVLDETSSTGLTDKQVADGILAPVYAPLFNLLYHTNYFALQEISTDEAILPFRGGKDWGDNGIYVGMHQHTYNATDPNLANTWGVLINAVSRSITAINTLPEVNDANKDVYLAEARGMRAYYSMVSLDLFGLIFVKEDPKATSTILRGADALEYIKSELLAVEPSLSTTAGPGRLTKAAVWGLLARLYLNSAVYRDRYATSFNFASDDMDQVIQYCDKIINSGQYSLSADYFSVFSNDNHTNKELIFALDQRFDIPGSHNRMAYFSISGDMYPLANAPSANGTDGPAITSDFYHTWTDAYGDTDPADIDPRFYQKNLDPTVGCISAADYKIDRGILRGQQYGLIKQNGAFVKCDNGLYKIDKLYNWTRSRSDLAVDFKELVDYTADGRDYDKGYRVEKYEFCTKTTDGRKIGDADIIVLRLADIYLMRAEAKLRKSNDAASALVDVNTVRASRTSSNGKAVTPAPALTDMNLELLFRERGFELYWEMVRRTDMIRFGKYEGTWTEKNDSNPQKRIFPIPQTAVDAASNIPGYLAQNPGY
ncbi:RagB/SusD family nutrient uptake outer membrane protein [Ohtaekwangia sp.]|uniref:RagB/SusD family nutrient uptake outer membrane protein n=1 Tax=Ohtaekwangia sp. TaxID=2066019 RepID=UPI002F92E81E